MRIWIHQNNKYNSPRGIHFGGAFDKKRPKRTVK